MQFGAVILCGGKNSRMGRDKAELEIGGRTFLDQIAGELSGFDELIISLDSFEKYPKIKYTAITDIYRDCGPMGGIHSALSVCESDALLVVPCDMPLFRRELGECLCSLLTPDADIVVPITSDGHIHTLCAVYRKQVALVFERYLQRGMYKILEPFKELRMKYISLDGTQFSEKLLKNINTPEEYKALCEQEDTRLHSGNEDRDMSISLEAALELLNANLKPLPPVRLPLFDTLGCITAEEVFAQINQPPFPRSPYDGYALRAADSEGASREHPIKLIVKDQSFAGKPTEQEVGPLEAVRIMTGGVIPVGADCVIPQEHTDSGESCVCIYKAHRPFDNYCKQGEDFLIGTKIIESGIPVTAAVLGVAASAGCEELLVYPCPKASVISTGDEIQALGKPLQKGQIYGSNSALLLGRLDELRIPAAESVQVCDEIDALMQTFESTNRASDIIISTGGVSAGQKDLVPEALKRLGAEIIFHGVSLKPGMPAVFAILNGKPVLAFSGNPFACAVTFELLARPALAALASDKRIEARKNKAVLTESFKKKRPVPRYYRGILADGKVVIPGEQGNGQIRTMIGCNCLVELPAGDAPLPEGEEVNVYMLGSEIYGI